MAKNNDNLPVNAETQLTEGGTITYANEVIAIISGIAANEVEGIAGMVTAGGLGEIISRNRNITRGVKVEVGSEEVSVDLYTIVEYGQPIQKVAVEVQENVRKSIESMTGLHVVRVDVHVQGVSFERDRKELQTRLEAANIPSLSSPEPEKKAKKDRKQEKASQKEEPEEKPVQEEKPVAEEKSAAEEKPAAEEPVEAKDEKPEPPKDAPQEEKKEAEKPEEEPKKKQAPVKRRKA